MSDGYAQRLNPSDFPQHVLRSPRHTDRRPFCSYSMTTAYCVHSSSKSTPLACTARCAFSTCARNSRSDRRRMNSRHPSAATSTAILLQRRRLRGRQGTAFQQSVWNALTHIAPGATTTYGALAEALGNAAATRAVGLANGANPISIVVPCHRVVGADGSLTGYGGGLHRKRWLLEHEGVALKRDVTFLSARARAKRKSNRKERKTELKKDRDLESSVIIHSVLRSLRLNTSSSSSIATQRLSPRAITIHSSHQPPAAGLERSCPQIETGQFPAAC